MTAKPSAAQIRAHYFRGGKGQDLAASYRARSLTAAAHHVVQRAKERIKREGETRPAAELSEAELLEVIRLVENEEGGDLTERERESAAVALGVALQNYDVLTALVANEDVNDVIVQAYDNISIQCGRRNILTDYSFPSREVYESFIENLLKRAGKACTTATPVVDAAVDSHVRACVTHRTFSPPGCGPMLTLRIARHRAVTTEKLVQWEMAPEPVFKYLECLARFTDATILVAGEVGTGKTTLVRALAAAIDPEEAILCIEDTHEIVLQRDFVRTLLTREANSEGAGRISPAQAIRAGMRMAMNRIILGEMRDAEAAEAFIDVCASGHPGFSTIHARSAKDAVNRLELFIARAQPSVDACAIRRQIANAVSVVVFLSVERSSGKRRIAEIVEVHSTVENVVRLSPIFTLVETEDGSAWKRAGGISRFKQELQHSNCELPAYGALSTFAASTLYRSYH